ncbi:HDIG domain-containing metalloprotein [Methanococcus voltae]|uniref:HDIG domain-containing metalloprotein n=1 Tax=Methanococcus voltae TaxID=2188 RepID=UPI00064E2A5E|nr:HDIG domain-containing metalloprotein [Methanococcus voltae]
MFDTPDFIKYLNILVEKCDINIVCHCITVSAYAYDFAKSLKNNTLDINLIVLGGLLHDIGRSESQDLNHGIIGAKILNNMDLPKLAKIAETHIGAGISKEQAKLLNLPIKDYIPETLEEKIIANVDNLTFGTKRVSINEVIVKFKSRNCSNEGFNRILNLYNELNELKK